MNPSSIRPEDISRFYRGKFPNRPIPAPPRRFMTEFFRFPHTPHIAWLGEGAPRDDKLLSPEEVDALLAGEVVVEEKLDGANLGLSLGLKHRLATCTSRYRHGPPEGIVIRRESDDWCEARAKLVRAEFTQTIGEHWRNRAIEWNRVVPAVTGE